MTERQLRKYVISKQPCSSSDFMGEWFWTSRAIPYVQNGNDYHRIPMAVFVTLKGRMDSEGEPFLCYSKNKHAAYLDLLQALRQQKGM